MEIVVIVLARLKQADDAEDAEELEESKKSSLGDLTPAQLANRMDTADNNQKTTPVQSEY